MEAVSTLFVPILAILGGSLLLYFGAEGLVRGSSSVAIRFGITKLVVGLTIVAFGTSSPELVVSISAALKGNSEISLGNVMGSNICNIALILGLAALIKPIQTSMKVIKTDLALMIGITMLMILMIIDGEISRIDAAILLLGIVAYNFGTIFMAKRVKNLEAKKHYEEGIPQMNRTQIWDWIMILIGIIILVLGANVFLDGVVDIARHFDVPDVIVGLTVVAFGTSLPELATSIVAAIKNEGDISIGNAVGSNIFNILLILGVAAMVKPMDTGNVDWIDAGVMLGVSVLLLPMAWTEFRLSRREGAVLLLIYFGYMYYLYLDTIA